MVNLIPWRFEVRDLPRFQPTLLTTDSDDPSTCCFAVASCRSRSFSTVLQESIIFDALELLTYGPHDQTSTTM